MIEITNDNFLKAVNYLTDNYPQNKKVLVHVLEGFDTIQTTDGSTGFGVFIPETLEIYIAAEMPEKEEGITKTLLHEYKHFMQYCEKKPFDEEEAEAFAEEIHKKISEYNQDNTKKKPENDLIRREEVISTLHEVFSKYNMAFGGESGGFAEAIYKVIENIPIAVDSVRR